MKLLIDAGNTRIKWGVYHAGRWQVQEAVAHAEIASLQARWQALPLSGAWGACVANEGVRAALQDQLDLPVTWVGASAAHGDVRNAYRQPEQMGADRWLAVLAARRLCADDVVVACAGTALTVESLTREGDYLGGLILPGHALMLSALARNTARLDQPAGAWADFPCSTEDALATGVLEAMAGAVERARARLSAHTGRSLPAVLVTGGDATRFGHLLARPARIVDNLVLLGLLEVADKS